MEEFLLYTAIFLTGIFIGIIIMGFLASNKVAKAIEDNGYWQQMYFNERDSDSSSLPLEHTNTFESEPE